ncbi:MAG: RNA-binding transcriptional accessory protein [Gammaproteobacteria bacterium]|nr:RNA-binding transcriptional accessory protein [Gammaproteobacteria bacterium]
MITINKRIADELSVGVKQVEAAITLLDDGATVPFISRYRKEATGSLDDTQLRNLEERLTYLRELEERRTSILNIIEEQGKLTPELARGIASADTKTRLEDLYLPYKKKRRTKGQIAIEAGIEPLADMLFENPSLEPEQEAQKFVHTSDELKEVFGDTKSVLDGAKFILIERFAENADLLMELRSFLGREGRLVSTVVEGKEIEGAKFKDYFDNADAIKKVPSHRALAMFRGRKEGVLHLRLDATKNEGALHPCESIIARHENVNNKGRSADVWLAEVVHCTWYIKLQMRMETELLADLRGRAEDDAITVFAQNLKDLLLAAPAGQKAAIGLDPGLRTGVKIAVIDNTGQFLDSTAIYPHAPRRQWDESISELAKMAAKYKVELLAIGNGTASRETDKLCSDLIKRHPELKLQKVMVSEAGASVYSASESAAREFPDLDVTIRGAVSIGRRLQDPLAELVKIEPKSIGVGQYQHDVSQMQLAKRLDTVVEDCVNGVGVDINTASAPLLRRVAGINQTVAENIVEFRNLEGQYKNRKALKAVPRLGNKAYEQSAGFLRIHNGDNPLDASGVHPESYSLVKKIIDHTKLDIRSLVGNSAILKQLNPSDYVDAKFGLPTVMDIISELDKPGRDPRPTFQTATFKDGVEKPSDLETGMILEGTVTNVTNFGAFVDIGVHQDGLVHISAIAHHFVKDPHDVVKAGDIVRVKVLEVDIDRKRIALSMRLDDEGNTSAKPALTDRGKRQSGKQANTGGKEKRLQKSSQPKATSGALASAFAKAKGRK